MTLHLPTTMPDDLFGARKRLDTAEGSAGYYSLPHLEEEGIAELDRLPFSIRVLLENGLRFAGRAHTTGEHVKALARWAPGSSDREFPFMPSRIVLQDFTGVPAVVDLAAMRSALHRMGGDPARINPVVPADLVIDHSVQVDFFGTAEAFQLNVEREMERNRERYQLLRWAQEAFEDFRVVPPGTGIVHQVNLEYLGQVVMKDEGEDGDPVLYPDTLLGTDSHTTMINGLGIVGWGVGGIEAEAVLLGQPYFMLLPEVVGVKFTGRLPDGATATDLVLVVTEMLREHGVVGRFVEYFGAGLSNLSLPDRATLANMSPEYGATVGFFPVDEQTLRYLEGTGRTPELVDRVERYAKAQNLFRTDETPDPTYTDLLELDLSTVEPSVAGPKRPQDRILVRDLPEAFARDLPELVPAGFELPGEGEVPGADESGQRWTDEGGTPAKPVEGGADTLSAQEGKRNAATGGATAVAARADRDAGRRTVTVDLDGEELALRDGSIVIAAITSCTNTSNPSVMVGAGLLAKKAVERGLAMKPWVKTSMAPGSRVVTDYLEGAGLLPYLEELNFQVVGYGCTTCIGNSGPLPASIARAIEEEGLVTASVLSGNRNFEARIHPLVRANYLASPLLVVAYALAGRIDIDLESDPVGLDPDGEPVYLHEIWPAPEEIRSAVHDALRPELFRDRYASVFEGDEEWKALPVPDDPGLYDWDPDSTYIQEPPFFEGMDTELPPVEDIEGARVLALLGESLTTDHISPAGAIPKDEPAGRYLQEKGVEPVDFNTFGSRRGNHEVMMRGTFGNVRIRNLLLDDVEGGYTIHFPTGETMPIYDAAMRYREAETPLVVLAGKEYGTGSSRDWAAKGTDLLGVEAVIAKSYERIHRSNLIGMGVLPLEFEEGEGAGELGLDGTEVYDITGIEGGLEPRQTVRVTARPENGGEAAAFDAVVRLDTPVEVDYYRNGGILHTVLREMAREAQQG